MDEDGNCMFRPADSFVNSEDEFTTRAIVNYAQMGSSYTSRKFSSPRYRQEDGGIGDYRKTTVCRLGCPRVAMHNFTMSSRYHVKCWGNQNLYYDIKGHLQEPTTCNGVSGICVDRLKLTFPGNGHCERCGDMSDTSNCIDRSGIGNEMIVEFITNRETNSTGF